VLDERAHGGMLNFKTQTSTPKEDAPHQSPIESRDKGTAKALRRKVFSDCIHQKT
jgi:hypothetical protein